MIFYKSRLNNETRMTGLEILEAYVGLAEHIFAFDSGLLIF